MKFIDTLDIDLKQNVENSKIKKRNLYAIKVCLLYMGKIQDS